ncbi:MAG: S1 RNA-binding domain-containing protein, partial [Candidatus Bipolaricaulia bacterium]
EEQQVEEMEPRVEEQQVEEMEPRVEEQQVETVEVREARVERVKMEDAFEGSDVRTYTRGDIIEGSVVQVTDKEILVDIGYKSEGIMPRREISPYRDQDPVEDEEIDVLVTYIDEENGTVYISERQAEFEKRMEVLEEAFRNQDPVKGIIKDEVKDAGYHVNLNGIRSFLPGSHLGNDLPSDIESLTGKEIDFKILELNQRDRNIVISHREYLRDLEEKRKDELFESLEDDQVLSGEIRSIVDFGMFVDIGGFEGLIHVSEINWKDLPVPPKDYQEGDQVEVKVLDFDREKERISLSIKRLRPNPWENLAEKYPVGEKFSGTVVDVTDFGAFVELEPDVEGLVHVSEMSWEHTDDPRQVVGPGDPVEVAVLATDEKRHRISLSMRRAQSDPWQDVEEKYPEGAVVDGVVTKLTDFGAFVKLEEGVEGLIHVSELDWGHVEHPADVLSEGDEIEAKILRSDHTRRKISLSLRELKEDPWKDFQDRYFTGSIVRGEITNIKDFGAFLRITDDVEGLIHVSEISEESISTPQEVLTVGDMVKAKIIGINDEKRQVRLSMRYLNVEEPLEEPETGTGGHETIQLREHLKRKGLA